MKTKIVIVMVLTAVMATVGSANFIDQQQTSATNTGAYTDTLWGAQSLSPVRDYLFSVDLIIYSTAASPRSATLEIRGGSTNYPNPDNTVLLASQTQTFAGTSYNWQKFDFSDSPIDIRNYNRDFGAGRLMLVVKGANGTTANTRFYFGGDLYAAGTFYQGSTGDWTQYNGDMAFKVFTDTVPEPATVVLLSLGGLLLRRRRLS